MWAVPVLEDRCHIHGFSRAVLFLTLVPKFGFLLCHWLSLWNKLPVPLNSFIATLHLQITRVGSSHLWILSLQFQPNVLRPVLVCVCTKSVPFNKLTETTTPSQTLSITTIYIAFVNTQRERIEKPGKSAQMGKRQNLMGT